MSTEIKITAGSVTVKVELNDTKAAESIKEALPIKSEASTWGDEVYFSTPVKAPLEDAKEVVEMGDVCYWPPGKAICLFFGPTPASRGDEIRPASPVVVVGKFIGDPTILKAVRDGDSVTVELSE